MFRTHVSITMYARPCKCSVPHTWDWDVDGLRMQSVSNNAAHVSHARLGYHEASHAQEPTCICIWQMSDADIWPTWQIPISGCVNCQLIPHYEHRKRLGHLGVTCAFPTISYIFPLKCLLKKIGTLKTALKKTRKVAWEPLQSEWNASTLVAELNLHARRLKGPKWQFLWGLWAPQRDSYPFQGLFRGSYPFFKGIL